MSETKIIERIVENCACFHFRSSARRVTNFFDSHLSKVQLRSTQFIILVGVKFAQPLSIKDLAKLLVQDRTGLSRNLNVLTRMGLIQWQRGQDHREKVLKLTSKGNQKVAKAIPYWKAAQKKVRSLYSQNRWTNVLHSLEETSKLNTV